MQQGDERPQQGVGTPHQYPPVASPSWESAAVRTISQAPSDHVKELRESVLDCLDSGLGCRLAGNVAQSCSQVQARPRIQLARRRRRERSQLDMSITRESDTAIDPGTRSERAGGAEYIRIAHLSDTHISTSLSAQSESKKFRARHRHGHNHVALVALDRYLKDLENLDVVVISGDLTRNGHTDSYSHMKDWLWRPPHGDGLGLNLRERGIHAVLVPGNHDRYGSRISQHSAGLVEYYSTLGPDAAISRGLPKAIRVPRVSQTIAFHLFDSSHKHGSFGQGYVEPDDMMFPSKRALDNALCNIAVLHHHCFVPNNFKLKRSMRMLNAANVLAFLLGNPVDLVLTGHTHRPHFCSLPKNTLLQCQSRIGAPRTSKSKFKQNVIRKTIDHFRDDCTLLGQRKCNDGRMGSVNDFLDYNFLRLVEGIEDGQPEAAFESPKSLANAVERLMKKSEHEIRPSERDILGRNRISFSMAGTACQAECPDQDMSINIVDLHIDNHRVSNIECSTSRFNGGAFTRQLATTN